MKISICSRKAIEELIARGGLPNTAVISFYDPPRPGRPHRPPAELGASFERSIQIALHDLDPSALERAGLSVETFFPEADALASFILRAKQDGLDVICQCEYGQSRSAACAAAILQHFCRRGIDVFADYRYYPNQLVYNKLFAALKKRSQGSDHP